MSSSLISVKSLASTLSIAEKMDLIAHVAKTVGVEPSAPATPTKGKKASTEAPGAPKKAKRERDPNAPKSDWLLFGEKVRGAISATLPEGAKIPGPVWMQTASALKEKGLMPSATSEQIVAAYQERLAHPPAAKPKATEAKATEPKATEAAKVVEAKATPTEAPKPPSPSESTGSQKKRGRKPKADMTPEELAKHNASVAAKKAAKATAKKASPAAQAAAAIPLPAEDDLLDFEPFTFKKGKAELKLLRNKRGDVLTEDMEWFGHQNEVGAIDMSFPKPADLDLA